MASPQFFIQKQEAPATIDDTGRRVLVEIDSAAVPYLVQAVEGRKNRTFWNSDDDYDIGVSVLTKAQYDLLMGEDMSELVNAVNRVYMAIRQQSVGEVFSDVGGQPPTLPVVPPTLDADYSPGVLGVLRDVQGIKTEGIFGIGREFADLASIRNTTTPSTQDTIDSWLDKIDLLGDASDITGIYGAVRGTVADAAVVGEEGANIIMNLMANIGVIGALNKLMSQNIHLLDKLDTLITNLGTANDAVGTSIAGDIARVQEVLEPLP